MKSLHTRLFGLLAISSLSALGFGQDVFSLAGTFDSMDAVGAAGNVHTTTGATSSYLFGSTVTLSSATLTEIVAPSGTTFASEARIRLKNLTTGKFGDLQFFTTSGYAGSTNATPGTFSINNTGGLVTSTVTSGDVWDLEFFESFDDSGVGLADQQWSNLSFTSSVFAPPPPPVGFTDLGVIEDTTSDYLTPDRTVSHTGGGITWYKIQHVGADDALATFLDIDTEGSTFDTEIGVYNSLGLRVANDDDDGSGSTSQLSFGQTSPTRTIGTSTGGNGRDGLLPWGTYYVAVGGFNTTFGASDFAVTTTSTNTTGTVNLNFRTNAVPEPATFAVLGLGLAGLIRRKRK